MANELAQTKNMLTYLQLPQIGTRLSEKLGLEEAKQFRAALSSAVATNPALLNDTEPNSVINAALVGHALKLPMSPQLGYYYIIPFGKKGQKLKQATFVMGYKGYIQLAMRSGHYRKLNVIAIKAGEFVSWNPLTEELQANFIDDPLEREQAETVGYCGYFEYVNGFRKMVFWTRQAMEIHADKYSPAYSLATDKLLKAGKIPEKDRWKYSSFWYDDFDMMAQKTVVRNMLSKWGSMSVEMQRAYEEDLKSEGVSFAQAQIQAGNEIDQNMGSEPVDTEFEEPQPEPEPEDSEAFMRD